MVQLERRARRAHLRSAAVDDVRASREVDRVSMRSLAHALPLPPPPMLRQAVPPHMEDAVKICWRVLPWRTRTRIVARAAAISTTMRACRAHQGLSADRHHPVARQAAARQAVQPAGPPGEPGGAIAIPRGA